MNFFLFILFVSISITQSSLIKSSVLDNNNSPIKDVNIKCGSSGTYSDENGLFIIMCDQNKMIEFSHINYKYKTIPVETLNESIILFKEDIIHKEIKVYGGLNENFKNNAIDIIHENSFKMNGTEHIEEILLSEPNINYAGGTSRARYYQIRGIGELSQFAGEGPPHFYIGYILDDINFSGIGIMGLLDDVKQIEVFKGPHSSIFGPNSMGGLINIITNNPTFKKDIISKITFKPYNGYNLSSTLSFPLTNKLFTRLSFINSYSDGMIKNVFTKTNNTNSKDEVLVRLKILYKPNKKTQHKISTYYIDFNNKYDSWTPDNNGFITFTDYQGYDIQKSHAFSLKSTYEFKNNYITTISTYSDNNMIYSYDADWANDDYWLSEYNWDPAIEGYKWSFIDSTNRNRVSRSQEFRLNHNNIIMGLYLSSIREIDKRDGWLFAGNANNIISKYLIDNSALYFKVNYQLKTKMQLALSLRMDMYKTKQKLSYSIYDYYTYSTIDYTLPDEIIRDNSLLGGIIHFSYIYNERFDINTSISRGYKTSGINQSPNFSNNRIYKAEFSNNVEFGLNFINNIYDINFTTFYIDRKNPQLRLFVQFSSDPNSFDYATFNGNGGYNYGFESDINIKFNKNIKVYYKIGFLKTHINTFKFNNNTYGSRETAHSPKLKYTYGLYHNLSNLINGLTINLELSYTDKFYFDDQNMHMSEPYHLINSSFLYSVNNFQVAIWANNITNTKYPVRGYTFALDPTSQTKDWKSFGDLRTYGITFKYNID